MICPACGRTVDIDSNFCSGCGERLPDRATRVTTIADEAERRVLTVMFCDLVGSTALAERVDAEALREAMQTFYTVCDDAVGHYNGHVVKHIGDGVMSYFGYPIASDDDAHSAVLAGIEICSAIRQLRAVSGPMADLDVRVGIHTGVSIVGEFGEGATREALSVGTTTNIASRLEGVAPAGSVVISDATRRLVDDGFVVEAMGPTRLKGVSLPLDVFRVLRPTDRRRRRLARDHFVGRRAEFDRVRVLAERTRGGSESYVRIIGEPGIGKTRFVDAAAADLNVETGRASCWPAYRNTFLHPVRELVTNLARIDPDDEPEIVLDAVRALVARADLRLPHAVDVLASVLAVDLDGAEHALDFSPQARRERMLEAVTGLLRGLARDEPLLLIVEDLHWADPSTLELLDAMATARHTSQLLVLMTARPDLRDVPTSVEVIHLDPLSADEVRQLIRGYGELDTRLAERIAERADGVPLFVEELVKIAGDGTVEGDGDVPLTLQSTFAAQLDRLGSAKRLAQLGSLLGRRFARDVVAGLLDDSPGLDADFQVLTDREIVERDDTDHGIMYEFRHSLVQDAAANSMIGSVRRRLHTDIASYYLRSGGATEAMPEVVGRHWAEAGHHVEAVTSFMAAGERALANFANREALAFYDAALSSLRQLANERPQDRVYEVEQHRGDIHALLHEHEAAEAAYRAAMETTDDPVRTARLLTRIAVVHQQHISSALRYLDEAEAALRGGESSGDAWWSEWLSIKLARMRTHYWFGESEHMLAIAEEVRPKIDLYASAGQRAEYFNQRTLTNFRQERYAMSDETRALGAEYVRAAAATGDVSELASAVFTYAFIVLFSGDAHAAIAELQQALALAERSGNRAIEVRSLAYLATAHRLAGRHDESIALSHRSVDAARTARMAEYEAVALTNLASIASQRGDHDEAIELADAALHQWNETGMAWPFRWLALFPRLAAAVRRGDYGVADDCCRQLLDEVQQRLPDRVTTAAGDVLAATGDQRKLAAAEVLVALAAESGLHPRHQD